MTRSPLLNGAWTYVKEYAAAVIAAALMYAGIRQIISAVSFPVTDGVLQLVNAIIQRGFRDRMPLPDYYGEIPWLFPVRVAAVGVIAVVVGSFVGLWVNLRKQRRSNL